jgi:hypothetical protein
VCVVWSCEILLVRIICGLLIVLAVHGLRDRLSLRRFCHHILMLKCPKLIWLICHLEILSRR